MNEEKIKEYLLEILDALYNNKMSGKDAVNKLNQNTELIEQVIEKDISFCISDCFWTIQHILEENITNKEIKYFIDCLKNKRTYNLEEKNAIILNK